MTEVEPSRQARAAETKKRRTREKLIHAADYVMRENGLDATVEAIAEEAGVSTATFYTFYGSRNRLCLDAVGVLVLDPMELAAPASFKAAADLFVQLTADRSALVHAAMQSFLGEAKDSDLIERLAQCLEDDEMQQTGPEDPDGNPNDPGAVALYLVATHMLMFESGDVSTDMLEAVVRLACGLPVTA